MKNKLLNKLKKLLSNNLLNILLLSLLLLSSTSPVLALNTYRYPSITNSARYYNNYRSMYNNPYGRYYNQRYYNQRYYSPRYYNPYRYYNNSNPPSASDIKKINKEINKIRLRNRLQNNIFSFLGYNNNYVGHKVYNGSYNPYNRGSLTGYSVPITNSALNLLPQNSYSTKNVYSNPIYTNQSYPSSSNYYSPTSQMKLIQAPATGQEYYTNRGRFYKDMGGLDSSTGVKIIYD